VTSGSPDVTARDAVLATIRTRRVVRDLGPEPVPENSLIAVLDAARWAPSAGNRRPHRFVAVRDPAIVRALRAVIPGMLQRPTAVVAICVDLEVVDAHGLPRTSPTLWVDVGAIMQTVLLAAHALGLGGRSRVLVQRGRGSCRAQPAGQARAPDVHLPGRRAARRRSPLRSRPDRGWRDLTTFERFPALDA
jgi:nitroreductase